MPRATTVFATSALLAYVFLLFVPVRSAHAQDAFNFFVASDMHQYTGSAGYNTTQYFRGAVEKMASLDAVSSSAFLITTGDQCPVDRSDTLDTAWTIDQYLGVDYPWYPTVGNHEKPGNCAVAEAYSGENLANIKAILVPANGPAPCEESTVSFDFANAHFVIINEYCDVTGETSIDGDIPDLIYNWLAADLEATSADHIFVFGHEPAYPLPEEENPLRTGHIGDSLDYNPTHRDRFWNLLAMHDADAFFSGHTHNNSRYFTNTVWQYNLGHSKGINDTGARSTFVRVIVDDGTVQYETYRDDMAGGPYTLTHTQLTHTISASAGPGGSISPAGISRVNHGSSLTVTITPDASHEILTLIVDGVPRGPIATYTFETIDDDHAIIAVFDPDPVYRFWNTASRHHFYTISESEKNFVLATWPTWRYEGVGFYAVPSDIEGLPIEGFSPVYRFWSAQNRGHFYTIDEAEKDYVIDHYSDQQWLYEGVAYYAITSDLLGEYTTPLYRFWSAQNHGHFYTIDENEKNYVIDHYSDHQWLYEGVAFYVGG